MELPLEKSRWHLDKKDISRLEKLRKEHEKASKLKEESLKKEAEDDLFDLVSRKTSISRRTSIKIIPTSYETVTQGSSIKPRTQHEELMSGISTPELLKKHLSAELKKDKKMNEMIEGRNIDEDFRNTQAGKSAGVAGWLKMPLFGHAIANHLRRPFYYF
ncbi:hypothetical protein BY996DRAFT_6529687 [Phakopsora pachyrhizi]|nr:hypothetical protein BY996DRAFT_6529687 [Phakopsora pachyrhizi]